MRSSYEHKHNCTRKNYGRAERKYFCGCLVDNRLKLRAKLLATSTSWEPLYSKWNFVSWNLNFDFSHYEKLRWLLLRLICAMRIAVSPKYTDTYHQRTTLSRIGMHWHDPQWRNTHWWVLWLLNQILERSQGELYGSCVFQCNFCGTNKSPHRRVRGSKLGIVTHVVRANNNNNTRVFP